MTTTLAEVDGALRRMAAAASRLGIPNGWTLHHGSSTNGINFALVHEGRGAIKLGCTRTKAWQSLTAMAEAFELAYAVMPNHSSINVDELPTHLVLALRSAANEAKQGLAPDDYRANENVCINVHERLDIEAVRRGFASQVND